MNILICYTPLHAVIAQRLIDNGIIDSYQLIYITFSLNNKHKMYYEKLARNAARASLLSLSHNPFFDFVEIIKWFTLCPHPKHSANIYVGNIKHFHSRLIIGLCNPRNIFTFDDGCGNISGSGYFYELNEKAIGTFFFGLLSPKLLYKNIINSIKVHYTVYSHANAYSNHAKEIKGISLISGNIKTKEHASTKTIYLGEALTTDGIITIETSKKIMQMVKSNFNADCIFPHPRSIIKINDMPVGMEMISSDMIIEDYALEWIRLGYQLHLLGIYSSALLNLSGIEGIKITNIRIPGIMENSHLDEIFKKTSCDCIDFHE